MGLTLKSLKMMTIPAIPIETNSKTGSTLNNKVLPNSIIRHNMIKTKLFTTGLLFIFSVLMLHAQSWSLEADAIRDNQPATFSKQNIVDTSIMECVYEHMIYDPVLKNTNLKDYILEIGKNASRYGIYGTYQRDSVVAADYPNGITFGEYMLLSQKYDGRLNEMLRYKESNKITNYERLWGDSYMYEEPIPDMDWTLVNEKDEICGHECQKATCSFRGREWTAWYCPDIEIDGGPWKFGGLPGLILKVEDSEKEHVFEAFQIRKSNKKFGHISKDYIKTDKKTFNKMQADYHKDPAAFSEGNPLIPTTTADGKPIMKKGKRKFYNPIEKE